MREQGTVSSRITSRFAVMPYGLKLAVVASFGLGVACILMPFVPGAGFDLAGRKLSHAEIWDTRVVFALLLLGPIMLLTSIGILQRRPWARPLFIVLPVFQVLPFFAVHWLFGAPSPIHEGAEWTVWTIPFAVWAVAVAIYLFGMRGPREYFAN